MLVMPGLEYDFRIRSCYVPGIKLVWPASSMLEAVRMKKPTAIVAPSGAVREAKKDDLSPSHLRWLVDSRTSGQNSTLKLSLLLSAHADELKRALEIMRRRSTSCLHVSPYGGRRFLRTGRQKRLRRLPMR